VRTCVGIPTDFQVVKQQQKYTVEAAAANTIARVVGALPLVIPALGDQLDFDALFSRVDGLMIPGGISNVCPTLYGARAEEEKDPFDTKRDATTLPLIRAALDRGVPLLMTCRGFQELNVALGGTLKQEPADLPEEQKHGTLESAQTEDERFRIRQNLHLTKGGRLAAIVNADRIRVNSLHSQLIDKLAPGLISEATAEDGTIEAATVRDAKGFALGVVFHPEYWAEGDAPSLAILNAFADAVRNYAHTRQRLHAPEFADA
jgi:putative glutamine amidotransferase